MEDIMMLRYLFDIWMLLLLLSICGCIDDTDGTANYGEPFEAQGIAIIGSDYLSTSVSIIDRETKSLFREGVIHSGSAAPGLSIALSGDVVFPLTPDGYGNIVLIDRYPNSIINFLDADGITLKKQLSVSTGFASNPHDYLRLNENKAYVTRYEKNPTQGGEKFDDGDDILIIDPGTYAINGRIELDSVIEIDDDKTLNIRPDRMLEAAGFVWVTCDYLSGDFNQAGSGLLLAIDPETDQIIKSIEIPEMSNCAGLAYSADNNSLYVSCTGLFSSGTKLQLERSGIVAIDLSDDETPYKIIARANNEQERPYGFELALLPDGNLLAIRFGNIEKELNDNLIKLNPHNASQNVVHTASTPFGLGGFLYDEITATLYVGDTDPNEPLIYLYEYASGKFIRSGTFSAHPDSGLPPRHIAFF